MFIGRKGSKKNLERYVKERSVEPLLLFVGDESAILSDVVKGLAGCFKAKDQPDVAAVGLDEGAHQSLNAEGHPPPQVVAEDCPVHHGQFVP